MAKTNTSTKVLHTHEGAPAKHITPYEELRRSVMACLLWEDSFYEEGEDIADRIKTLCQSKRISADQIAGLAVEAREQYRLRHAPLLLVRELARHYNGAFVGRAITKVIQRADELAEFVALYWRDGKQPLAAQVKKGLASAFRKFDEYQLAKYNRDAEVKLRDVLFLCHAKPRDAEQEALWKRLVDGKLKTPDTWEVALSSGADKAETFQRLIAEKRLGYMALLRNIRNMKEAGVPKGVVGRALMEGAKHSKALPFRFIAAAKMVPEWEDVIEAAMLEAMVNMDKLPGKTVIAVDCSGSMAGPLSNRSQMARFDAAAALAMLVREVAEEGVVYAFGTNHKVVPPRRGVALRDALNTAGVGHGTNLRGCIHGIHNKDGDYDRLIVITDEQSITRVPDPTGRAYMVNVANYKHGVGYGKWLHIDGFSEAILNYIQETEAGV